MLKLKVGKEKKKQEKEEKYEQTREGGHGEGIRDGEGAADASVDHQTPDSAENGVGNDGGAECAAETSPQSSVEDEGKDQVLAQALVALRMEVAALREMMEGAAVRRVNESNREMSPGALTPSRESDHFTQGEVRAMTPGEVRDNYEKILASMKHWH